MLVVTEIERTDDERLVSVQSVIDGQERPVPHGRQTLLPFRFNGTCPSCQHPASATVWKIKNVYVPAKRARELAMVAAQDFQTDVRVPAQGTILATCRGCGADVPLAEVRGRFKQDVACDARCTSAHGHNCECSCGGANHGADWQVARLTPLGEAYIAAHPNPEVR